MHSFFNASNPVRNMVCGITASKSARIPPNCIILDNWVFENFILAHEPFAKSLRSLKTCVVVNNSLCGKLAFSLKQPIAFDERFKVISVPFLFLILTY